jgi:hypothetical protein
MSSSRRGGTNKLLNHAREMRVVEAHLPFTSYAKKEDLQDYSPQDSPYTNTQHNRWQAYSHVCVPMVTLRARCKKHRVEHKLSDIFEALRLSWV